MILLPAIDLKQGKVVRLKQGDFNTVHTVSESAEETAKALANARARWINMVDLDGARSGAASNNRRTVAAIAANSGLKVEIGGGIRSEEGMEEAFSHGVSRGILGSAAVEQPELVRRAVTRYPEQIAVGLDALNGRVRTAGWEENSGLNEWDFAREMHDIGVKYIIYTDIATDGMLSGPSYGKLEKLQQVFSGHIIASGGVTTIEDIRRLRAMGIYGAIVGKAYYAGTLDLAEAVEEAGDQRC